ncbi:MAG: hypothetical protein OXQ29_13235 [Rhodospirillaceae bacterium]|nr:hypothetical protein [Rhodospirillaceae bacterium]
MNDDPAPASRTHLTAAEGRGDSTTDLEEQVRRLEAELLRCRNALKKIRDRSFEQANSPRLIDQLWHFVRWSKSVAREALEGSRADGRRGARRQ